MKKYKITAAGGDIRMLYAAAELLKKYDVELTGFSEEKLPPEQREIFGKIKKTAEKSDVLLLPPVTADKTGRINAPFAEKPPYISELLNKVKPDGMLLYGVNGENAARAAEERGIFSYNYMKDEALTIANAIPTAEAALKTAMEATGMTIWGSKVLVTGFGRIGTILTDRLIKLGASVTAAARKETDLIKIRSMGARAEKIMPDKRTLSETDVIFNTVPAEIFGKEELMHLKRECVFIDLASAPGGAKKDAVKETGCKYLWATGLPGKAAPKTAGLLLADAVSRIIEERVT